MKKNIITLLLAALALITTGCSESHSGPTVTPPSWKGFNYSVKKATSGEEVERGDVAPGDEIRVFAVRKNEGKNIGKINGTMHLRYTVYTTTGAPQLGTLESSVTSVQNDKLDGWEDPYATFQLPAVSEDYEYYKVEVGCQFYFNTFGNQYSEVDYSDNTSHEEPYIGHIYTNLNDFHPMNGGAASSKVGGSGLEYHTLYISTK